MDSAKIRSDLKSRIAKGLNFGIEALEEVLNPASVVYNRFILLKSKYNDLMYISSENTLPYDQIEIGLNRLRGTLLTIVDELTEEDFGKTEIDHNLKVNALSNRRTNFFNLLNIHFKNLDQIVYREEIYLSEGQSQTVMYGREALALLYGSVRYRFGRKFEEKEWDQQKHVIEYFQPYFENYAGVFEVYFKTLKHILTYIDESEIEKQFFINTIKSQLSRYELIFILYYALSGIDPEYPQLVRHFQLLNDLPANSLIHEKHLAYIQ